jgi:hypothetical protein
MIFYIYIVPKGGIQVNLWGNLVSQSSELLSCKISVLDTDWYEGGLFNSCGWNRTALLTIPPNGIPWDL